MYFFSKGYLPVIWSGVFLSFFFTYFSVLIPTTYLSPARMGKVIVYLPNYEVIKNLFSIYLSPVNPSLQPTANTSVQDPFGFTMIQMWGFLSFIWGERLPAQLPPSPIHYIPSAPCTLDSTDPLSATIWHTFWTSTTFNNTHCTEKCSPCTTTNTYVSFWP